MRSRPHSARSAPFQRGSPDRRHRPSDRARAAPGLAALCAVGALVLPGPEPVEAASQARDTVTPADTTAVDSVAGLHGRLPDARLDSLRVRAARIRAAIVRLRMRHGARVRRVDTGLRFELPYPLSGPDRGAEGDVGGAIARVADLARRYYPSASIAVLGTVDAVPPPCGSDAERTRAQEIIGRLREHLEFDSDRIRRGTCLRTAVADGDDRPRARADTVPGATVYIEWDPPDGSS